MVWKVIGTPDAFLTVFLHRIRHYSRAERTALMVIDIRKRAREITRGIHEGNVKALSNIQFPLRLRFLRRRRWILGRCTNYIGCTHGGETPAYIVLTAVQFRDQVHQKYYYFDAHERRTEGEKVLMTEYYAAECKNHGQITGQPSIISLNLLRIDIYNPLRLISLSASRRLPRESLVMRNLLVREREWWSPRLHI